VQKVNPISSGVKPFESKQVILPTFPSPEVSVIIPVTLKTLPVRSSFTLDPTTKF
jgi:hypothetical protein